MMRTLMITGLAALALAACETTGVSGTAKAPQTAEAALKSYYSTIPDSALPTAPAMASLPAEGAVITRVLFGSCMDEELDAPILNTIAATEADLFLMIGDNVYGDIDGRRYANNEVELSELRESFAELGAHPAFQAARAAHPMMVTWDDHDYGANDSGASFPFRTLAERVHERFFDVPDEAKEREGVYYARTFGPEGQRTQVIMLDTRYFRSDLVMTDEWGAEGKQRWIPDTGAGQVMLGEAQWAWLEGELKKPADVRLIASSIQVLPDVHGWESWDKLPGERQRLFDLIDETNANGVVFLSGDRHTAFLYEETGTLDYPAYEITSSSLNKSFSETSSEMDANQVGTGYAPVNFGSVQIDWEARSILLSIHDEAGQPVRTQAIGFDAIGITG